MTLRESFQIYMGICTCCCFLFFVACHTVVWRALVCHSSNSCAHCIPRQKPSVLGDVLETACLLPWSRGLPMHVAPSGLLGNPGANETVQVSPTRYCPDLTTEPLPQHLLTSQSALGFWGDCSGNNRVVAVKSLLRS